MPPVIRTVPEGCHRPRRPRPEPGRAGGRRRPDARTAIWSSPRSPASTLANRSRRGRRAPRGGRRGRPSVAGSSSAATRPRPHDPACAGSRTSSSRPTDTAPLVTAQTGAVRPASPSAWTSAAVPVVPDSPSASSDSTPTGSTPAVTSASRVVRSARSVLVTSTRDCARADGVHDGVQPRPVRVAGGDDDQPGPGGRAGRVVGQPLPGLPEPPGVHCGLAATTGRARTTAWAAARPARTGRRSPHRALRPGLRGPPSRRRSRTPRPPRRPRSARPRPRPASTAGGGRRRWAARPGGHRRRTGASRRRRRRRAGGRAR